MDASVNNRLAFALVVINKDQEFTTLFSVEHDSLE